MGQVNVVLIGQSLINDKGSFTLTGGVLDRDPIRKGANGSAINGALNAFAMSAAIELERGIRINVVSPTVLDVSAKKYDGFFPGHVPVSSERVGYRLCEVRRRGDHRTGDQARLTTASCGL